MHHQSVPFALLELILFAPRILNYVVAAYLILVGILGLGLIR
jgi:hypothetical protein